MHASFHLFNDLGMLPDVMKLFQEDWVVISFTFSFPHVSKTTETLI